MFFEEQSLYSDYGGVAFDKGEGEEIAKALGEKELQYFKIMVY